MSEKKPEYCIYFEEDEVSGLNWFVAQRDSKRVVESGHCETYQEAVVQSKKAYDQKEIKSCERP